MAESNVNNGVNVDALLAAREALKGAPEAAKFTWRASCKWQNGTHSKTQGRRASTASAQEQKHKTEFSFEADHPEIFASEDLGATPVEFVLVGLASCLTAGVAAVAQNRGIQLRSVEAKLEGLDGHPGHPRHRQRRPQRLRRHQGHLQHRRRRVEEGDRGASSPSRRSARRCTTSSPTRPTSPSKSPSVALAAAAELGPSNASRRSSSAPGTPGWRRAAASPSARSITSCSSAARWPTPGAASAGTRCGC